MNLQEHIRRIVKEETKMNISLIRRLSAIDNEIYRLIEDIYKPDKICKYKSGEELLDVVGEAVIDFMYFNSFSNLDDNGKLWNEMYYDMVEYIKDKYGKKIIEYYHINCGN